MPLQTVLYTLGHSNTGLEEFLGLLAAHRVEAVADVRSYPGSRRHPHFGRVELETALSRRGIDYAWFPDLGGRRKPKRSSPHIAWQVPAFRAYADYMDTRTFAAALGEMLDWARGRQTSLLCAERLWWQCHRRLLSDRLLVQGHRVEHILSAEKREPHRLTEFLRVEEGRLFYDLVLPLGS
jgi:uncharacterized protein (DUF488 family)